MRLFSDLLQFTRERFPVTVTMPLSAVLFAAPFSLSSFAISEAAFGLLNVFLFLLLARMQDDLSDIAIDRTTHPERSLVSGAINPSNLRLCLIIGTGIVLVLNYFAHLFLPVITMIFVYAIFCYLKQWIALPLHPIFVNAVFFFIPLYAGLIAPGSAELSHILLGLFIWAAVIAHDFAHSVHGPTESSADVASFSSILGSRGSAITALCAFVLAGLIGLSFWIQSGRPLLFSILLTTTFVYILFLGIRLVKMPNIANAKPFYVYGFAFFLLPLLGLIIDNYLGLRPLEADSFIEFITRIFDIQ